MTAPLPIGLELRSALGNRSIRVCRFIGAGSRGGAYEVQTEKGVAVLKVIPEPWGAAALRETIADQVEAGAPHEMILWPADLVDFPAGGQRSLGYVMPLRPSTMMNARDFLTDPARHNLHTMAMAARHLAECFGKLNRFGYSCRDFSPGDLWIEPVARAIALDLAEKVAPDHDPRAVAAGPLRFLAPEIARGEAAPNEATDRHVLAVAIFLLLFAAHPLEGGLHQAVKDASPAARRIYGERPTFIFDPDRTENRPIAGARSPDLWHRTTSFVRKDFGLAFTTGLRAPWHRPSTDDWRVTLTALIDAAYACRSCQARNFFCSTKLGANGAYSGSCQGCGRPLGRPLRLDLDSRIVVLEKDVRLSPFHLVPGSDDLRTTAARVVPVPGSSGRLGLKNEGSTLWQYSANGATQAVAPGRTIPLNAGVVIEFGRRIGKVEE